MNAIPAANTPAAASTRISGGGPPSPPPLPPPAAEPVPPSELGAVPFELAAPGWGRSPSGPLARSSPPRSAGAVAGVGSNVTQPIPVNHTSTQEWASRSRTRNSPVSRFSEPGEKPETTRAGTPAILSISAIAPENCWQ